MKYTIIFNKNTLEYTVKLKRNRWWWWLLLLLLPLLLLIRCEKDVYVKTINSTGKKVVSEAEVTFRYQQNFLYDSGIFFTDDSVFLNKKTDASGVVLFGKLKYSVYSWIFKHNSKAIITALNGCYQGDTAQVNFHSINNNDTILLELIPTSIHGDFKVVDADDSEPLPEAIVELETEYAGLIQKDTAKSLQSGIVVFSTLPKCGKVKKVKASAKGYYPDSIMDISVQEILSDDIRKKRLLKLKPIRKPITFYVVDCNTKVGLPGVECTIEFRYPNRKKTEKATTITNENGVGKGVYDSAAVVSEVYIRGTKTFYKDGFLQGGNNGWHKVENFIDTLKYNREKRTFCLEPKPQQISFINVDSISGTPIPNVTNYISINNDIKKIMETTVVSGANGQFSVSLKPGEIISIIADNPHCFKKNSKTIKNTKSDDIFKAPKPISIPLAPVLVDLIFKTVEDADHSNLVPDASLLFTTSPASGVVNPPNTSGNGEFIVKARLCSNLSITASKNGYKTNNYTIAEKPVEWLQKSTNEEREIPLKKEITAKPCSEPIESGTFEEGIHSEHYQIGNNSKVIINFKLYSQADAVIVYCGKKNENNKTLIWDSEVAIEGDISRTIKLSDYCNSDWVTIEVKPGTPGSNWLYQFNCLDE
jgi:hypothetical protein